MEYIIIGLLIIIMVLQIIILLNKKHNNENDAVLEAIDKQNNQTIDFIYKQIEQQNQSLMMFQQQAQENENARFMQFGRATQENIHTLRNTVATMSDSIDNRFENFQKGFELKVQSMQESNERKLDQMKETVDEKLQKTLEDKINQSFKLVSERLEQVYISLGEMQKLSSGVDDLKKVLSNVKTRGILGEVQLGAILEQILSPNQYDENVVTKKDSRERVEYAIKLPGNNDGYVYLPIDAKFPLDAYQNLLDAYDTNDKIQIDECAKILTNRIKGFAKDISKKYIDVPNTTDFAIMFLPIEGLYAEVVRRGMIEELQSLKINIAGPTTMAALLNSFQMGFKTLAIQKHSSEVWDILESVKQEFEKFGNALESAQKRMRMASDELENLVGVRTRQMQRKLQSITNEKE